MDALVKECRERMYNEILRRCRSVLADLKSKCYLSPHKECGILFTLYCGTEYNDGDVQTPGCNITLIPDRYHVGTDDGTLSLQSYYDEDFIDDVIYAGFYTEEHRKYVFGLLSHTKVDLGLSDSDVINWILTVPLNTNVFITEHNVETGYFDPNF